MTTEIHAGHRAYSAAALPAGRSRHLLPLAKTGDTPPPYLRGVHGEVEGLMRYRDLIEIAAELREQRAREDRDRPMILAGIVRRNFLERGLFY